MAITFIAAGTLGSAGSGNPTAPGLPAGWAANDIHVLLISAADNVIVTLPAGWTKKFETNGGTALRQTVAWRRAVGGDTAPTVTHTGGDGVLARIYGFRGCSTSGDPIEAIAAQANAATATCTAPAITPLNANAAIVFLGCEELTGNTSNAPTWGTFSGTNPTFTQLGGTGDQSGLGVNDISQNVAWGLKTDTTTTGSRTAVISGETPNPTENIGCLLALTPLGAGSSQQVYSPSRVFVPRKNVPRFKQYRPFQSRQRFAYPNFSSATAVGVSQVAQWRVRTAVGVSSVERWRVTTKVGASRIAQWVVRSTVGSSRLERWTVRSAVGASRLERWVVRSVVGSSRLIRWTVRTAIGVSRSARWVVRSAIGSSRLARWVVRRTVGVSSSLAWRVRVAVGSSRLTRWVVRSALAVAELARWRVATAVGASRLERWRVLGRVGSSLALRWHVAARVGVLAGVSWRVRSAVTRTVPIGWRVAVTVTAVGSSQPLAWSVGRSTAIPGGGGFSWIPALAPVRTPGVVSIPVGRSVTFGWSVASLSTPVGTSLGLHWTVRLPSSAVAYASWRVRAPVATRIVASWRVRTVAGRRLETRWNRLPPDFWIVNRELLLGELDEDLALLERSGNLVSTARRQR